jgi:hypothetical protein
MLFKQLTGVGIISEREAGKYVRYPFLVILLGCVVLRLCVFYGMDIPSAGTNSYFKYEFVL